MMKQARRLGGIGGVHQVHGAGNIGLDADGLDVLVVGAGAGHFEHRLAGVHGEVHALAAAVLERGHQQAVAATIARAEADHRNACRRSACAMRRASAAIAFQVSARPPYNSVSLASAAHSVAERGNQ